MMYVYIYIYIILLKSVIMCLYISATLNFECNCVMLPTMNATNVICYI